MHSCKPHKTCNRANFSMITVQWYHAYNSHEILIFYIDYKICFLIKHILNLLTKRVNVYILRHGKAEELSERIKSDSKRRLTESGIKELEQISKFLKATELEFTSIVSSPLTRAKQTAEIVSRETKFKKTIVIWNELKPEINADLTLRKLSKMKPDSSVLLIGHEPHLSSLISEIISETPSDVDISLKKGGFAHVRLSFQKGTPNGSLRSLMTPKQLKKLSK